MCKHNHGCAVSVAQVRPTWISAVIDEICGVADATDRVAGDGQRRRRLGIFVLHQDEGGRQSMAQPAAAGARRRRPEDVGQHTTRPRMSRVHGTVHVHIYVL